MIQNVNPTQETTEMWEGEKEHDSNTSQYIPAHNAGPVSKRRNAAYRIKFLRLGGSDY